MMTNANGTYLLATNFGKAATVEVYDSNFAPAKLAGTFTDPTVPTGYAPYSVHAIGSQVFVTYAFHNAQLGATIAPGNGMVNVFDNNGNFVAHVVAPGGNLNALLGTSHRLPQPSVSSAVTSSSATSAMATSTSMIPKPSRISAS